MEASRPSALYARTVARPTPSVMELTLPGMFSSYVSVMALPCTSVIVERYDLADAAGTGKLITVSDLSVMVAAASVTFSLSCMPSLSAYGCLLVFSK